MRMTLEPGETFEHTHRGLSTTTLIEGAVDIIVGGSRSSLVIGVPMPLAPNVSHVLVNVGEALAALDCVHELGERPTA